MALFSISGYTDLWASSDAITIEGFTTFSVEAVVVKSNVSEDIYAGYRAKVNNTTYNKLVIMADGSTASNYKPGTAQLKNKNGEVIHTSSTAITSVDGTYKTEVYALYKIPDQYLAELSSFSVLGRDTEWQADGIFVATKGTSTTYRSSFTIRDANILGVFNSAPTINITSPAANQTLYENDTLNIAGNASDADNGNSVTIRYQINASTPRAIKAFVSTGAAEAFGKNLTFRGGNLYDGDTLIASGLTDGVPHTLKVWGTDDQGGTSPIVERTFYVVPNRAPSLTVNPPVISGLIDSDEIEFTGSFVEPDGNQATVSYRINGGGSVQVAQGVSGDFDFKIRFGQLKVGLNNIVVEVIDSYGAKTSRTVKLQKDEVTVEQLKSTARYRIKPPLGTATGVVAWVQRDTSLTLNASISMTQTGEAENFVSMEKKKTAQVPNQTGIVEDQFQFENTTAVDNIILQLDMERSSLTANEKIHAITGVVE